MPIDKDGNIIRGPKMLGPEPASHSHRMHEPVTARNTGIDVTDGVAQRKAIGAILDERRFQDGKHGPVTTHGHTIGEWIIIIESELAEAKLAVIKGGKGRDSVLAEICQVAATAMACMEQHGTEGGERISNSGATL